VLRRFIWFALPFALVAVGCGNLSVGGELVKSDKPRDTSPDVASSDLDALVTGNTQFALDLYHQLADQNGNLFFSPYSLSAALAMTYAGARGETERQMAETLNFTLSQENLHPAFNDLDLELARRGEGAEGRHGEPFRLHIANALWGQTGYSFLPQFLDLLAENYDAGMRLVDFIHNPDGSRSTINKWVSSETEKKIEELISRDLITPDVRLVLTNAIYFDAAWEHKFKKEATRPGPFKLLDDTEVTVDMMRQNTSFGYTEGEGYQAVELPYDGRELSLVVLLPAKGNFTRFQDSLDGTRVEAILKAIDSRDIHLTMPRFAYESGFCLKDALSDMGMPDAFLPRAADFSRMDGTRDLFILDVVHKALVRVDEEGTEAAAAAAVIVAASEGPPDFVEVVIDRPFIFLIRDIKTGGILFLGRVLNPLA
jgi:serpin B